MFPIGHIINTGNGASNPVVDIGITTASIQKWIQANGTFRPIHLLRTDGNEYDMEDHMWHRFLLYMESDQVGSSLAVRAPTTPNYTRSDFIEQGDVTMTLLPPAGMWTMVLNQNNETGLTIVFRDAFQVHGWDAATQTYLFWGQNYEFNLAKGRACLIVYLGGASYYLLRW